MFSILECSRLETLEKGISPQNYFLEFLSHDFWVRDRVLCWLKLTRLHSSVFSENMVKSVSALAPPAVALRSDASQI